MEGKNKGSEGWMRGRKEGKEMKEKKERKFKQQQQNACYLLSPGWVPCSFFPCDDLETIRQVFKSRQGWQIYKETGRYQSDLAGF